MHDHTHVVMHGNRFYFSACSSDAANFKSVGRGLLASSFSVRQQITDPFKRRSILINNMKHELPDLPK